MEGESSRSNRKRPFFEDDVSNKPPTQKRVRFPKGKKAKPGVEAAEGGKVEDDLSDLADPRVAAKERSKRRNQFTAELLDEESTGIPNDILAAEETYEDNENFVEDGIQIEPFNLNKEREEGYFDAEGNYVEYVNDNNEIKDAWLDSVQADPRYAGKAPARTNEEDSPKELSSEDIGKMKRRIADLLKSEETVLQALRRLKGTSNNRKEKMSAETKVLFDQLTEDAMKLLENGEYNVYHEKKEVFQREAEGYERLAQARGTGLSAIASNGNLNSHASYDAKESGASSNLHSETAVGATNSNLSTAETSGGDDAYDMFADDDEPAAAQPTSENHIVSGSSSDAVGQLPANNPNADLGTSQSDYVYDESSGYYYSSTLGYYYDPSTGLYCSALSGQWYSFNEETGTYEEVQAAAPQQQP